MLRNPVQANCLLVPLSGGSGQEVKQTAPDRRKMAHDVFISYASPDTSVADAVCDALEEDRIPCWIAPRDVIPGEDYDEALTAAIKKCRVMVVIFSAHCNNSRPVKNEVQVAADQGVTIIPFRIQNVKTAGALEYHLSRRHWLDAFTPPLESHFKRLSDVVRKIISDEHEGPPEPEPKPQSRQKLERKPKPQTPVVPPVTQGEGEKVRSRRFGMVLASLAVVIVVAVIAYKFWPMLSRVIQPPDINQQLIEAVGRGDNGQVENLLARGAEVNTKDARGSTSLMLACSNSQLQVAKLLVEKGADVNATDKEERTALIIAVSQGNPQIVKLLLEKGADPIAKNNKGEAAVILAADQGNSEVLKLLIEKGADVNAKDGKGKTSLIVAADRGNLEVAKLLVEKGADVSGARDSLGRTPLIVAAGQGNIEIVKLLLAEGADLYAKDNQAKTALDWASERGHASVVKLLKETIATVQRDLEKLKSLTKKYHEFYVASDKDEMIKIYDFPINYLGREYTSKTDIDRELEKEFAKWIDRESKIESIEIQRYSFAAADAAVHLTHAYHWTDLGGQELAGTAMCVITWKKVKGNWKIKGFDEKREKEASDVIWRRAVVTDPDGYACMRGGKGTNFKCLVQVPHGQQILAEKSDEEWIRIRTPDGHSGFMHSSRLRMISE